MKPHIIEAAIVFIPGDPDAGISDQQIKIKGPLADLGVFAEEDRQDLLEVMRGELEAAFGDILDQIVTVVFDFEIDAADAA